MSSRSHPGDLKVKGDEAKHQFSKNIKQLVLLI
jgi:hypothetical protein